jgi:hypothetical protein
MTYARLNTVARAADQNPAAFAEGEMGVVMTRRTLP